MKKSEPQKASWFRTKTCFIFALFLYSNPHQAYANDTEDWKKPSYIFKAFKEIALKNEYAETDEKILKWQKPIRFSFQYHQIPKNQMVEKLFEAQFKQLSRITGLPIIQDSVKPNLTIHLTKDANYNSVISKYTFSQVSNLNRKSHCMGSFTTSKKSRITNANIVLPLDHVFSRGLLVNCIIEESYQVMGLPNDSDWVYPSVANDASKIVFMTGLDSIMLTLLYSKTIKPGMEGQKLNQTLKNEIKKLHKSGDIHSAQDNVKKMGLFPLIN